MLPHHHLPHHHQHHHCQRQRVVKKAHLEAWPLCCLVGSGHPNPGDHAGPASQRGQLQLGSRPRGRGRAHHAGRLPPQQVPRLRSHGEDRLDRHPPLLRTLRVARGLPGHLPPFPGVCRHEGGHGHLQRSRCARLHPVRGPGVQPPEQRASGCPHDPFPPRVRVPSPSWGGRGRRGIQGEGGGDGAGVGVDHGGEPDPDRERGQSDCGREGVEGGGVSARLLGVREVWRLVDRGGDAERAACGVLCVHCGQGVA